MSCIKVVSSQEFRSGKRAPKFALFAENGTSSSFGVNSSFLGWYATKEDISKETSEIQRAMASGANSYTLKYSAKTEMRWGRVRLVR